VLHMDRGILYSLKELLLRPGHLMRGYLEGRRAKQVKPLLLVMITAAAVVLLSKYLAGGDVLGGMAARTHDTAALPSALATTSKSISDWMNAYFAAATLLLLPFEAGAFRLAFHRVGSLNYPKWLVIAAFLTVQTFVFWSITLLLQRWVPGLPAWSVLVSTVYGIFSLMQLLQPYARWKSLLRGLLDCGLFFVVIQVVMGVPIAVVMATSAGG